MCEGFIRRPSSFTLKKIIWKRAENAEQIPSTFTQASALGFPACLIIPANTCPAQEGEIQHKSDGIADLEISLEDLRDSGRMLMHIQDYAVSNDCASFFSVCLILGSIS